MAISDVPESIIHLITENEPLWPLTSLHVGGPARWLAKPKTISDLSAVFAWIQEQRLSYVALGGGTNTLFADDGYPGVVIWIRGLKGIQVDGTSAVVSAGERLSDVAKKLNRTGLSGLEWACGIPGTVGGAVVMNAGTRDGEMASVLESVRVLTTSGVSRWPVKQLGLGYRTSSLRTGSVEGIVLEAHLKLHQDDTTQCVEREQSLLAARHKTQPRGASCGCIFKNPELGPPAGMLLDRAGCKGLSVGAATVSNLHANFIINEGTNNAQDVMELIRQMRARVLDTHGIDLKSEVVIVD